MDNLTLIIHEAGHSILGIFGWRLLTFLGGTLFQILLPLLVFIFGWRNRKTVTTQLSLFWLGFSWLDTSAYCADANLRQLPLVGNLSRSAHDFFNTLNSLNLLEHFKSIAWSFYALGMLILIAAILWPLITSKETEYTHLDLGL